MDLLVLADDHSCRGGCRSYSEAYRILASGVRSEAEIISDAALFEKKCMTDYVLS